MESLLRPKKLLDRLRDAIRLKHAAYRTEEIYTQWIRRYILPHDKRIVQLAIQFRPNFFNSSHPIALHIQHHFTFR